MRVTVACLLIGLAALATFALSAQHAVVNKARRADSATQLAAVYQEARFWVGQEESLESKYRLEPSPTVLAHHLQAERNVDTYLNRVLALDRSPSTQRAVAGVLESNAEYTQATYSMFAAVAKNEPRRVDFFENWVAEPAFTAIQSRVYEGAATALANATRDSATLRRDESEAFWANVIAIGLGIGLVGLLGLIIRRHRRARSAMQAAELERLGRLVVTDPLTGLRNHRAFDQDLAQEIQRTSRTGLPLALVMLDVDDLKTVNDTAGHKAGDRLLKGLADTLALSHRATDRAYRIGGDEFALILTDAGEWAALQLVHRLQATLANRGGAPMGVTAGIVEAVDLRGKDDLVRDAYLALISARRAGQDVAVYTPDMKPSQDGASEAGTGHHTRTLASALALAVDAKDSYTRSHCQTVSTLCAAIAKELGFDPERLAQIRLAGLLHDVGKIGIPDAILKKPTKLTAAEYEQMKTHTVLGEGIILAAEMETEARWVRHHHERIDGDGYPDQLRGREIPLESRIIHVADAFEAMTSDRPYRVAPGERFAIEELRRHAGTQFDTEVVEALLRVIRDPSLSSVLRPTDATASTDHAAAAVGV